MIRGFLFVTLPYIFQLLHQTLLSRKDPQQHLCFHVAVCSSGTSLGDIYTSSLFLILECEANRCWGGMSGIALVGAGCFGQEGDMRNGTSGGFRLACLTYLGPSLPGPGCLFWHLSLPSQNYWLLFQLFPGGHSSSSCELLKTGKGFIQVHSGHLMMSKMNGNSKEPETNNDSYHFSSIYWVPD